MQDIGLDIKVLVHDMGSNLLKTKKYLEVTHERPYFDLNGKRIFFFADPPHLIKATRNNVFKNKLVDVQTKEFCNWDLIRSAFYADNQSEKLLPRITQKAIDLPDNRDKMRVKYAAKTLSGSMAYAIQRMLREGRIADTEDQAPYLLRVIRTTNGLFDVFNSDTRFIKLNKQPFRKSKEQLDILSEGKALFSQMEVQRRVDKPSKSSQKRAKTEDQTDKKLYVQFIKQWQNNITALPLLFDELHQKYDVTELPTKRINQDCIENFFGQIRAKGGASLKPNAMQFGHAFKKLFVTNVLNVSAGTNCESEFCEMLLKIGQDLPAEPEHPAEFEFYPDRSFSNKIIEWRQNTERNMILSGYWIRKIFTQHDCNVCREALLLKDKTSDMLSKESECNTTLIWPSNDFAQYVNTLTLCFDDLIMDYINEANVVRKLSTILKYIEFEHAPPCDTFINITMRWFLKFFTRTNIYFLLKRWKNDAKGDKKLKFLSMKHFNEADAQETYEDVIYLDDNDVEVAVDLMPDNNFNVCEDDTEQYDSMDVYYVDEENLS